MRRKRKKKSRKQLREERKKKKASEMGRMKVRRGAELENLVFIYYSDRGFITYRRVQYGKIDVLAINPSGTLCYVIECKNYSLSKRYQIIAVKQLNRNLKVALDFLENSSIHKDPDIVVKKVLIAKSFNHQSRGFLQLTIDHILDGLPEKTKMIWNELHAKKNYI